MINRRRQRMALRVVCLFVGILIAGTVVACPTCKEGLEHADPAQRAMASGFYYSILFMMSMPFVILGTFGSFAYFAIRKADTNQQRAES